MTTPYVFVQPFGNAGNRAPVPTNDPMDGSMSYQLGYTPDYQLDLNTQPDALPILRTQMNQVLYDATNAIFQYQSHSVGYFITTSDNGGSPFPYDIYARAYYNPGSGFKVYENQVQGNTTAPAVDNTWVEISQPVNKAQQSYACYALATGTANAIVLTPVIPFEALVAGSRILFTAAGNNSSATTVNISALGAKDLFVTSSTGYVQATGGEIITGCTYEIVYDGTNWFLVGQVTPNIFATLVMGASQSISNNTSTLVNFNTVPSGGYDPSGITNTGNKSITAPLGGLWEIGLNLTSNTNSNITGGFIVDVYKQTGVTNAQFFRMGQQPYSSATDLITVGNKRNVILAAGDIITIEVISDGGNGCTLGSGEPTDSETWFSMRYLGR